MRFIFSTIVIVHALIHLMGFLKGFNWYHPKELTLAINKYWGALWLLSTILLSIYAYTSIRTENELSLKIGFGAILLSQILIIKFWPDAKYGTIVNALILVVLIFGWAQHSFSKMVSNERRTLRSTIPKVAPQTLTQKDIQNLPVSIQKWLTSSGSIDKSIPDYFTILQSMRMKLKPDQAKWYTASAEQMSTMQPPAFIWKVEVDMLPLVQMIGRDKFVDGKGAMFIKLNGAFPVVDAADEKIDEGALQRYLGEIAWAPGFAVSPHIQWETIDDHSAKASMSYKGVSGSGIFHFDDQFNFSKFVALRFKGNDSAKRFEWIMTAEEYGIFDGITIPTQLKATWILEDGAWTWLEMKVKDLTYHKI